MKLARSALFLLGLTLATSAFSAEPFEIQAYGSFKEVLHTGNTNGVVTGASPPTSPQAGGTHGQGHAEARIFREPAATGMLLGFHTGAALEGVASHPGARFHVHYANVDLSVSGHVDEYRVPQGATLMLPRR